MIGSEIVTHLNHRWVVAALVLGGVLAVTSLALLLVLVVINPSSNATAGTTEETNQPASVEPIEGTELSRVILTEKAAERLGIQTTPVSEAEAPQGSAGGDATPRTMVPYAALLYDVDGGAFVYTNPEPLTFIRAPITVDYIDGDNVVLLEGPPSGTEVVTVGATELFGAEFEFEQ